MNNGVSCKVVIIYNIRFKIFDSVVITLCDIRHIPYLRKNLILFSTLECNGFSYKSTSRIIKVNKCVLTVMKG